MVGTSFSVSPYFSSFLFVADYPRLFHSSTLVLVKLQDGRRSTNFAIPFKQYCPVSTYPTIIIHQNTDLARSNPPAVVEQEDWEPTTLPVVHLGTAHVDPGDLAKFIMKLRFKKARFDMKKGGGLKTPALVMMHALPPKREPFLRPTKPWAVMHLLQNIQEKLSNITSAMIQIVGDEPSKACLSCINSSGPWAKCVVVRGVEGITSCGNCYWSDNKRRCEFYRPPDGQPEPVAANRRRPPVSRKKISELADALEDIMTDLETFSRAYNQESWAMQTFLYDVEQTIYDEELDDHACRERLRQQLLRPPPYSNCSDQLAKLLQKVAALRERINQGLK